MLKYLFLKIGALLLVLVILFVASNKVNSKIESKESMHDYVTKECGTEPAFDNEYWDEKRPGIYVDYNTGEALFSSLDKYDSGTGWPSFTKPINESNIEEETDKTLGIERTEVKTNASHLGHVFNDGPNNGSRYCINSAALKFIPYEDLEKEGYGEYKKLFPYKEAVLAGGCFWGTEYLFQQTDGVIDVVSGYTGGKTENPTYEDVSTGKTGYAESILVIFDPKLISYSEVLDVFWRAHNPTEVNKQGPDIGTQYRSAIFYMNEEQKNIAEQSKKEFNEKKIFNRPAATEIVPFEKFYKAEEYHQNYVDNHPGYTCHALRGE